MKDRLISHRVPERGIREKRRPGWAGGEWRRQKETGEVEPEVRAQE